MKIRTKYTSYKQINIDQCLHSALFWMNRHSCPLQQQSYNNVAAKIPNKILANQPHQTHLNDYASVFQSSQSNKCNIITAAP